MKITAQDLLRFGIIDQIVSEPVGGAHRAPQETMDAAGRAISDAIAGFDGLSANAIRDARAKKFLNMGRKA